MPYGIDVVSAVRIAIVADMDGAVSAISMKLVAADHREGIAVVAVRVDHDRPGGERSPHGVDRSRDHVVASATVSLVIAI